MAAVVVVLVMMVVAVLVVSEYLPPRIKEQPDERGSLHRSSSSLRMKDRESTIHKSRKLDQGLKVTSAKCETKNSRRFEGIAGSLPLPRRRRETFFKLCT